MQPKKQPLPDFATIYVQCFGFWAEKHKHAALFFGVSEQTARRWYNTNNPPLIAHRYLTVHHRGYLPLIGGWQQFRIDQSGVLHTPYGNCTAGDLAMLWRYKWSAEHSSKQYREVKAKLSEIQSGSKMKMIKHTADYLNRLVHEMTSE